MDGRFILTPTLKPDILNSKDSTYLISNWEVRNMGQLKDLTLHMARAVVSESDQVRVEEVEGASMIVLELSVAPDDMGRIIGKEGRVANAMRTLLRTSAAKDGKRVNLEII
jgi:predicted RNA-binding protein YlqC (UPF0109 family)